MNSARYIMTIATGKKTFIDMGINLARSFLWWHQSSDIVFQLVTDQPECVPEDVSKRINVLTVKPGELGTGFSSKLRLDQLVKPGQTLFVDSDCLIFGNMDFVFDRFKGKSVSVIGNHIASGEWFGNIETIIKQFNLDQVPKFNGGIYYLEEGPACSQTYATARELEKQYDEIGFVRLRGQPNDEVIMSLAMALNGQVPIPDDGTIMSDPQACQGGYTINVLKGKSKLNNPAAPHPLHQSWYPFNNVSPVVVHFLGYYTKHYPYRREAYKLRHALSGGLNLMNRLTATIKIEYPERAKNAFKNFFRPIYRKLVGIRKIKPSDRM